MIIKFLAVNGMTVDLISSAYLLGAESSFDQDSFNPLNMIALQLYKAVFYGSSTGQF